MKVNYLETPDAAEFSATLYSALTMKGLWISLLLIALLLYKIWPVVAQYYPQKIGSRRVRIVSTFTAIAVFVGLTYWFQAKLPYDTLFYGGGRAALLWHIWARLIFFVFFIVMLLGFGELPLRLAQRKGVFTALTGVESFCIRMLAGSAVLRIVMLALGFANLYHYAVILPLGIVGMVLGWPVFTGCLHGMLCRARDSWTAISSKVERVALSGLWASLVIALIIVAVRKLVTPDGTGDYYTHYFHYYLNVIQSGGLAPNEVWYHFFISKGVGDVFFAMILSDPLAPAIVSAAMFILTLAVVYALTYRMTQDGIVSLFAITMLSIGFINTYDTTLGFAHWADFAKQHVTTAGLYLGCVWASWMLFQLAPAERWRWAGLVALAYVGLIIMRPQFVFMMSVSLGVIMLLALVRRRVDTFWPYVVIGVIGAAVTALLHAINYAITGLAEVTPFRLFWPWADQEKLAQWISPFLGLQLELGSSPDMGGISPPDFSEHSFSKLSSTIFRLRHVRYFFVLSSIPVIIVAGSLVWNLLIRRRKIELPRAFWDGFGVWLAIIVATMAAFMLLNQVVSMFRFTVFALFPVMALPPLLFFLARKVPMRWLTPAMVTVLAVLVAYGATIRATKHLNPVEYKRQITFSLGMSTLGDAYHHQAFHWEPGVEMCARRPKDAPIWYSTVLHLHFIAPHCLFQTFFSYSMGKEWHTVMFGSPDEAKAALQDANINYFAFNMAAGVFDPMPYAPLFKPETMSRYFSIVWQTKDAYLLTWKSPDLKPVSAQFVKEYRKSMQMGHERADFKEMHSQMNDIYRDFKAGGEQWPVRLNPDVPHPRGWQ